MRENVVYDQSKKFAIRIVNLYKYLTKEMHETVMSKQILRSGTSIGANLAETLFGNSRPSFRHKLNMSLGEANETHFWLEVLHESAYLTDEMFDSLMKDCNSIIYLLVSSIRTTDSNDEEK